MPTATKKGAAHRAPVRPQDDLFRYVNGAWIAANPIPAHEARWGGFMELRLRTDQQLRRILGKLEKAAKLPAGSPERLVRDLYRSGMDTNRRNALGLDAIAPLLEKVRTAKDKGALEKVVADLHRIGVAPFFGAGIDQDMKDSQKYLLYMAQGGMGLPDRDYYLRDDAESVRVRTAYRTYAEGLYRLMGRGAADAKREMETLLRIETALARSAMKREEMRDPHKTYNPYTVAKLAKDTRGFDWPAYLKRIRAGEPSKLVVMQPAFLKAAAALFAKEPLDDLKAYVEWHLVNAFSSALSDRFDVHSFSFYGTVLTGVSKQQPRWRRMLGTVNGCLGMLLGRIYVDTYFPPESKRKMDRIVDDLFTAFEARIKALDWMSPATKKKSLAKLRAMNRKIGYPEKWKSYAGLEIRADDYVGNLIRCAEFEHKRAMQKLKKPLDRHEWHMLPQTVNAYYSPSMCDIVFPAAILQVPFFDRKRDDAYNYGGIGMVIGHEITHGFDDEGSKFDAQGNLKNWWTKADREKFEKKADVVRKQYDAYEVVDGLHVNGQLTLGENIADLGGLSIALDAYRLELARTGRKDIGGRTPEQRFFEGFAEAWREHDRPEYLKLRVLNDPHSPDQFRVNGPASNIDAFYEAYGVKKGDGLYRPPAQRAKIW